jgi:ferredoxin
MCERVGVKLVNLREAGFVATKTEGRILKEVYLSKIALEADIIVNLPKLKTHSLVILTGGIKNMYGVIPAGLRRQFHGEYVRVEDFSQLLVDIFAAARPHLTIMDGIVAMEGEGPGSGNLRKLGIILASRDTVALDAVMSLVVGLDPLDVLTTCYASEMGLGISDSNNIIVVGEKIESVAVPDFRLPVTVSKVVLGKAPRVLSRLVVGQISPRPRVQKKNCTACGECVRACPTGAATIPDKTARINDGICIRCMCCHEVCRFNAIIPRRPFFGNLVYGVVSMVRRVVGK